MGFILFVTNCKFKEHCFDGLYGKEPPEFSSWKPKPLKRHATIEFTEDTKVVKMVTSRESGTTKTEIDPSEIPEFDAEKGLYAGAYKFNPDTAPRYIVRGTNVFLVKDGTKYEVDLNDVDVLLEKGEYIVNCSIRAYDAVYSNGEHFYYWYELNDVHLIERN